MSELRKPFSGVGAPRALGLGWVVVDSVMQLDRVPLEDTKAEAFGSFKQVGGPVVRALSVLASLGIQSDLIGQVGDDGLGRFALESLDRRGIGSRLIRSEFGAITRHAQVWLSTESGSRTIVYHRGDLPNLGVQPGLPEVAQKSNILLFDGRDLSAAYALAQSVPDDVCVVIDAGGWKAGLEQLAARATVLILSASAFSLGPEGPASALSFAEDLVASKSIEAVIVTAGSNGTALVRPHTPTVTVPAVRVKVVDSNGAGDVYFGGVAFGLLRGLSIEDAAHFAATLAAISCRFLGDSFLMDAEFAALGDQA